jgi:hypothetical protein
MRRTTFAAGLVVGLAATSRHRLETTVRRLAKRQDMQATVGVLRGLVSRLRRTVD